jgi:hypothetical protein
VLNQSARVPLPAAWYGVPGFWHMNGVTLAMAILANNRKWKSASRCRATRQAGRSFRLHHCVGAGRKIDLGIERH